MTSCTLDRTMNGLEKWQFRRNAYYPVFPMYGARWKKLVRQNRTLLQSLVCQTKEINMHTSYISLVFSFTRYVCSFSTASTSYST